MIAGLTFGALRVSLSIEKQFFVGVLITAVTAVLPIFSPDVYILSGMLFVAGMSFAPTMVVVMNLGTIIVPPSRITEGLTWMTTGISIGVALGGVLAGLVIDAYGARAGFGVAIGAGLVMVVIVLLGLRTLRATSAVCAEPSFQ
jgi:predicted MFS family arabinose efflux permease